MTDTSVVVSNISDLSGTLALPSSAVGKYIFLTGSGTIVLPTTAPQGGFIVLNNQGSDTIDVSGFTIAGGFIRGVTLSFVYNNNVWINM
jgi:hypothetical protein